jgi:hypothetical protein
VYCSLKQPQPVEPLSTEPTAPAQLMARLIHLEAEDPFVWHDRDFADVLAHQLRAPLVVDLAKVGLGNAALHPCQVTTFNELLHHPNPDMELLMLCKNFAKAVRFDPDWPLPAEVATVLYLASIAAARIRINTRISAMSDHELRASGEWALAQAWVDPQTKSLFFDLVKLLDDART